MTLAKRIATRLIPAAALLALAVPVVAGTVVASSGPSAGQYRVGSQVANSQRITLAAGDRVTVLDNGSTRVLQGPGTFTLAQRGARANNSAFSALTAQRRAGRARVASSRGDGTAPTNPNLWYVDIAKSGTICVRDLANIRLWRANTNAAEAINITAAGEAAVQINFPAREGIARWATGSAPREGVTYSLGATQISFKRLPEMPDGAEAMAQALINNGCTVQLEQLVAATLVT